MKIKQKTTNCLFLPKHLVSLLLGTCPCSRQNTYPCSLSFFLLRLFFPVALLAAVVPDQGCNKRSADVLPKWPVPVEFACHPAWVELPPQYKSVVTATSSMLWNRATSQWDVSDIAVGGSDNVQVVYSALGSVVHQGLLFSSHTLSCLSFSVFFTERKHMTGMSGKDQHILVTLRYIRNKGRRCSVRRRGGKSCTKTRRG